MNQTVTAVPNVVVVDPRFDAYQALSCAARLGRISLHMRSSGAEAIKLARHLHVDVWLIAVDLDDMSGHDLVELLRGRVADAKVAAVEGADVGSRRHAVTEHEAAASGADAVLAHPITLRDLEQLLGLTAEERSRIVAARGPSRAFVAIPVGLGAAAVSVALLLFG